MPEDISECQSCGYVTKELKGYKRVLSDERRWLCHLCANTAAGEALEYPAVYPREILAAICYVGNVILERIAKLERK